MNPKNATCAFRLPASHVFLAVRLALCGLLLDRGAITTAAAEAATVTENSAAGAIQGRVFNARSGAIAENARVTVAGTSLVAFTNADGNYRLPQVPAGTVTLRVFFTGFAPHAESVLIAPGQVVQHDFILTPIVRTPTTTSVEKVVQLDSFEVAASREMDAAAIAINEQRFAANLKNVVSTDEFGAVAEGNVATFLRFLPGITVTPAGGDALTVSIDGAPAANTPVTLAGFDLPNPNNNRAVEVGLFNLNNVARVEVSMSPTPESPGSALAGSINMVPRSSFERTKPMLQGSVYVMMRDDAIDFDRIPSLYRDPRRVIHPGFDLSWIVPVNKRFGFTVATGASTQYSHQVGHTNVWRGVNAATDGNAFPHTSPGRPYLSAYTITDSPLETSRKSLGATLDFRISSYDRIALGYHYTSFDRWNAARSIQFNPTRIVAGSFTPTSAQGVAGAGNITSSSGGTLRSNLTSMPTLNWRHDGLVWKAEAGVSRAYGVNPIRDADKGILATAVSRRAGVTIDFDRVTDLRPGVITAVDNATRAPVDPFSLESYSLTSISSNLRRSSSLKFTTFANVRRDFLWRVPVSLKGGLDYRQSAQDLRGGPSTYAYRDSMRPGSAAPFLDAYVSQRAGPYGFPRMQFTDNKALLDYFRANPNQFALDENAAYRSRATGSRNSFEAVSATYIRGDVALLNRRLKFVGGLRVEQTNIRAEGPLTDPTRNIRHDANGRPVLDAAGRPVPVTTNPLEASQLTLLDRRARVKKEYLRLFPSLNASYELRDNLLARAAISTSIGPPSFQQYAGGSTLPDADSLPSPTNRISVNNAGIKPWMANSTKLRLEYYFEGVGQFSAGVFRRDYKNFFANAVFPATPDFLALYGLDPDVYGAYDVATQYNLPGAVRMEGVDFSYKQALTFLPTWARGIQVFANWSSRTIRARNLGAIGFLDIPRSGSWGVSLTRPRFSVRANVSFRAAQRGGEVSGSGIEADTYNYTPARNTVDVLAEYALRKRFALFANLRDIGDVPNEATTFGPSTPTQARLRTREHNGSLWTFGLKGTF